MQKSSQVKLKLITNGENCEIITSSWFVELMRTKINRKDFKITNTITN